MKITSFTTSHCYNTILYHSKYNSLTTLHLPLENTTHFVVSTLVYYNFDVYALLLTLFYKRSSKWTNRKWFLIPEKDEEISHPLRQLDTVFCWEFSFSRNISSKWFPAKITSLSLWLKYILLSCNAIRKKIMPREAIIYLGFHTPLC